MGVNDLVEHWNAFAEKLIDDAEAAGVAACAEDIGDVARTAWNPVSEPPTEADADQLGYIAVGSTNKDSCIGLLPYWEFVEHTDSWAPHIRWARIRDVVLMPPQGGE